MILAPVIQPACVVLRVHLECEVKGAVSKMGPELHPFPTLPLALIGLNNPSLARDTRVTRVTSVCGRGERARVCGERNVSR